MAPEILTNFLKIPASLLDLRRIDIWALGMVIYAVINPDIPTPFKKEIQCVKASADESLNVISCLRNLLKNEKKPTLSSKYVALQQGKWRHLKEAYEMCTTLQPSRRLNIEEVLEILDSDPDYISVFPLEVHQGSVVKKFDQRMAIGGIHQ